MRPANCLVGSRVHLCLYNPESWDRRRSFLIEASVPVLFFGRKGLTAKDAKGAEKKGQVMEAQGPSGLLPPQSAQKRRVLGTPYSRAGLPIHTQKRRANGAPENARSLHVR